MNAYPNSSTGYSPFYLNWGYHPVTFLFFLRNILDIANETVAQFLHCMDQAFVSSQDNTRKANEAYKRRHDRRRHEVIFNEGDWVVLSTVNLHKSGTPAKLQRKFVGPFKVVARHSDVAYELQLPPNWRQHPVFHVSLLKPWRAGQFTEIPTTDADLDVSALEQAWPEYKETDKILRWRYIKERGQVTLQFLITFKNKPIDESA